MELRNRGHREGGTFRPVDLAKLIVQDAEAYQQLLDLIDELDTQRILNLKRQLLCNDVRSHIGRENIFIVYVHSYTSPIW